MNRFSNVTDMWKQAGKDILEHGETVPSRDGFTKEVIGWSGQLLNPTYNMLINKRRALSTPYAAAEILWYLSRMRETWFIEYFAPSYGRFAQPVPNSINPVAYGAYGYRIANPEWKHGCDQIETILQELEKDRENDTTNRRLILSLWNSSDLDPGVQAWSKDLPCNVVWQFFMRKRKLHMCVYMRSQDFWLGMPYDIFCNTCIQMYMANRLHCFIGTYTHSIGSLHIYNKHLRGAEEAAYTLNPPAQDWYESHQYSAHSNLQKEKLAVQLAIDYVKNDGKLDEVKCDDLYGSLMGDLLSLAIGGSVINNPNYRKARDIYVNSRRS